MNVKQLMYLQLTQHRGDWPFKIQTLSNWYRTEYILFGTILWCTGDIWNYFIVYRWHLELFYRVQVTFGTILWCPGDIWNYFMRTGDIWNYFMVYRWHLELFCGAQVTFRTILWCTVDIWNYFMVYRWHLDRYLQFKIDCVWPWDMLLTTTQSHNIACIVTAVQLVLTSAEEKSRDLDSVRRVFCLGLHMREQRIFFLRCNCHFLPVSVC
jgi:hypothetical protein